MNQTQFVYFKQWTAAEPLCSHACLCSKQSITDAHWVYAILLSWCLFVCWQICEKFFFDPVLCTSQSQSYHSSPDSTCAHIQHFGTSKIWVELLNTESHSVKVWINILWHIQIFFLSFEHSRRICSVLKILLNLHSFVWDLMIYLEQVNCSDISKALIVGRRAKQWWENL